MSKDTNNKRINLNVYKKYPLVFEVTPFQLLNGYYKYRKLLYKDLNQILGEDEARGNDTWKNRFLDPGRFVPKKNFEALIAIMNECLARALKEMLHDVTTTKRELEDSANQILTALKNHYHEQEATA